MFLDLTILEERGIIADYDKSTKRIHFTAAAPMPNDVHKALGTLTGGLGLKAREEDILFEELMEVRMAAVVRSALS